MPDIEEVETENATEQAAPSTPDNIADINWAQTTPPAPNAHQGSQSTANAQTGAPANTQTETTAKQTPYELRPEFPEYMNVTQASLYVRSKVVNSVKKIRCAFAQSPAEDSDVHFYDSSNNTHLATGKLKYGKNIHISKDGDISLNVGISNVVMQLKQLNVEIDL